MRNEITGALDYPLCLHVYSRVTPMGLFRGPAIDLHGKPEASEGQGDC